MSVKAAPLRSADVVFRVRRAVVALGTQIRARVRSARSSGLMRRGAELPGRSFEAAEPDARGRDHRQRMRLGLSAVPGWPIA